MVQPSSSSGAELWEKERRFEDILRGEETLARAALEIGQRGASNGTLVESIAPETVEKCAFKASWASSASSWANCAPRGPD